MEGRPLAICVRTEGTDIKVEDGRGEVRGGHGRVGVGREAVCIRTCAALLLGAREDAGANCAARSTAVLATVTCASPVGAVLLSVTASPVSNV